MQLQRKFTLYEYCFGCCLMCFFIIVIVQGFFFFHKVMKTSGEFVTSFGQFSNPAGNFLHTAYKGLFSTRLSLGLVQEVTSPKL